MEKQTFEERQAAFIKEWEEKRGLDLDSECSREALATIKAIEAGTPPDMEKIKDLILNLAQNFEEATPNDTRQMWEDEVLFWGSDWEPAKDSALGKFMGQKLCLNCNDLFLWGAADAEEISMRDLPELSKIYKEHGVWGTQVWVANKRNMIPQTAVLRDAGWQKAAKAMGWSPTTTALEESKDIYDKRYDYLTKGE